MFVVVPVKFDKRDVNIAGIHYRINSIGIESLLPKPWVELLHKFPKYQTGISINLFLKLSAHDFGFFGDRHEI